MPFRVWKKLAWSCALSHRLGCHSPFAIILENDDILRAIASELDHGDLKHSVTSVLPEGVGDSLGMMQGFGLWFH